MRIGLNPQKDQLIDTVTYLHQIVIPVYIPNQEGYFKDSFAILQLCLASLFRTVHEKTFITVVNNGSCREVKEYADTLYQQGKIQEVIHTDNIGKLNAILKGIAGNAIELVTITDADVLFLPHWQAETAKIFKALPKVGVVGIVPQFNMFKANCENVIYDNLFSSILQFIPVKCPKGLVKFYKSIGWDEHYNKDFLEYALGIKYNNTIVYVGSGHFVATYKKQMFNKIPTYFDFKLGGNSENYLDTLPLQNDYWRVSTYDNYGYHMGNVLEDWMSEINYDDESRSAIIDSSFAVQEPYSCMLTKFKIRFVHKVLFQSRISKLFYTWKKLPKYMVKNYNIISTLPQVKI